MDPERWQRIESIFQKALDAGEDRQARVLVESCAGDEVLRREVESLLAQHENAREFMDRPAFAGPARAPLPPLSRSEDPNSAGIPAGTVIGHYRIVGKIGSGGMGVVYEAEDLKLGRHVALKFLPEEVAGHPRALKRFRVEAQAASALNHPNICTIHEVDEVDGLVFIAMELLEGRTLQQTISGKRLPLETVIDFGVQIAGAIDAAHAKGVVHRDIKPANIFVMKQRRIKVLDFGLAKLTRLSPNFEETGMTDGTEPGMVMGTVGYMSPEQLRGQGIDGRTDIFAFGAILYEMLAGRRAFEKPTSAETMAAILNEEPPAISELAPNTPPALVRIVKRCLEKEPEQRFQSASDLAFALEALSRHGNRFIAELEPPAQIDAGSGGETRNERLREERGKRFRRWLLLAGAVLAVIPPIWYLRRPLPPLHVSGYAQITHDGGPKFAVGTDGIRLYLNVYPDSSPPAQVPISGGEITRVPVALPNPWLADVSPDGSTLLVSTDPDPGGPQHSIWSVQVPGPSLRHLTDGHFFPYATSAAWSPDGESVVFSTTNGDINVMGSDGTVSHTVANLPYHTEDFFRPRIAWSPDGNTIRFDRNKRIYEMKPDGSGLHPFLPGWRPSSGLCCGQWTPDGKFFEFLLFDPVSSRSPNMPPASQIWALDERRGLFWRAPAEPVQLTSGPTRWNRPIPGKDGKKIFATGSTPNGQLVRMDAKSGQLLPYLGGISAEGVTFSPDGRFIAYVKFPEGILWRANRDGSSPMQLTDPPLYPSLPHWSPDGAQILFSAADTSGYIKGYLIPSQGGPPRPILPENQEGQVDPNWSPDGRKIVFDTRGISDAKSVALRILDLTSHQVTTVPGSVGKYSARWSPNGRFIAGTSLSPSDLAVFELETERWSVLQKGEFDFPAWSRDGRFIYFVSTRADKGVFRIRPSGGKAERVVDLEGFHVAGLSGIWMALDPEDLPMLLRDAGGIDIYALTLEEK